MPLFHSGDFPPVPQTFGCEYLAFQTLSLAAGSNHEEDTTDRELAIVLLGGTCSVSSSAGDFPGIGGRSDVFSGLPHTLYLPIQTRFTITAETPCELAFCYSKAEERHPLPSSDPAMFAWRSAAEVMPPARSTTCLASFPAHRLLICEVFTPGGNWSSYPPHKHDVHNPPGEVDLEEIYYFRLDRPEGYAIQKVYTADRRIDETMSVRDGELVLIPGGLSSRGRRARLQRVLPERARRLGALHGRLRRPGLRLGARHMARTRPRLPLVAEENRMDVMILGRIGYDLYSEEPHVPLAPGARFSASLGGSSANMAVGLSRLGARVGIVSCLGDDSISRFLIDFLNAEKVDTAFVQTRPAFSLARFDRGVPSDRFPKSSIATTRSIRCWP